MKKNIRNILSVFIVLISCFFTFNNIYAKDIKIHATVSNTGNYEGVVFQTFLGTYSGDRAEWNGLTEFDMNSLTYYYADHHFDFPSFFGGKYADSDEWNSNTVRTFSYIIHNKPLTIYDANVSGKLQYGYVTDYRTSSNKYSQISAEQSSQVNTIEFKRLTNGYEIVKTDRKICYL